MIMFRFEQLEIWQVSMALCERVYRISQSFPAAEQYGITSQVRRSAVSISANIAEGAGRSSDADFARFIDISFGSLMETVSHLNLAKRIQLLDDASYQELYEKCESIGKMLTSFRNRLRSK
jgi:four helix bundle protein